MSRGKFIIIEGADGSGKSTVIAHLKSVFPEEKGFLYSREPGGTVAGERIRDLILETELDVRAQLLLFYAARQQHVTERIVPALEKGINVVSDRFSASTYAYQVVPSGDQAMADLFLFLEKTVVGRLADEVHYIYIDTPVDLALKRIDARKEGFTRFEKEDLQMRVRVGYEQFFSSLPRVDIVDGTGKPEDACARVEEIVRLLLVRP